MKMYDSYSKSILLWNKSFPSHWNILPMYAIAKEKSICNCVNLPLLSVYLDIGVIPFSAKSEKRTNVTSKDLSKYQRVDVGDFVINNQQAWRGSVGVSFYTGIVSPAYIVLSINDKLDSKYANYLFRSPIMVTQYLINSKSVGSIQRNIYWSALKRINIPIPPRSEQDQIIRFLDWKVSRINKLIAVKRKQIKELDGLKKAIINNVVTHGVNTNVAMKDSDVDWLGKIPVHWKIVKIKKVTSMRNEKSKFCANTEDKYIGLENIVGYSNQLKKTDTAYDDSIQNICYKGDLMFSKLRPYLAKTIIAPFNGFCTGELLIFSSFIGDIRYLRYILLHKKFINAVDSSTYGAKMPRANTAFIINLKIPFPPKEEQKLIADYLDESLQKLEVIIDNQSKQIHTLQDFKISLISDVVTGKIDIRDIKIPDYEYVEEEINETEDIDKDITNTEQ